MRHCSWIMVGALLALSGCEPSEGGAGQGPGTTPDTGAPEDVTPGPGSDGAPSPDVGSSDGGGSDLDVWTSDGDGTTDVAAGGGVDDGALSDGIVVTDVQSDGGVDLGSETSDAPEDADEPDDIPSLPPGGGPFTYSGPGYPTFLPMIEIPESVQGAGGLSMCDEQIEIPVGADAPGACTKVDLSEPTAPNWRFYVNFLGYDCALFHRQTRHFSSSWKKPAGTLSYGGQTFFDWTATGLPARDEYVGPEGTVIKTTWSYYDDEKKKEVYKYYHAGVMDFEPKKFEEDNTQYSYSFYDDGKVETVFVYNASTKWWGGGPNLKEGWSATVYEYNEAGLESKISVYSSLEGPESVELTTYYLFDYDDEGRKTFEGWYSVGDTQQDPLGGFYWTYIPFDGGYIERLESGSSSGTVPKHEMIFDSTGLLRLWRTDMNPEYETPQCPYGPCWGGGGGTFFRYVYDEAERRIEKWTGGGDDVLKETTNYLERWEYDSAGRESASGEWVMKDDVWRLDWIVRYQYDCWDYGTAAEGYLGP
ncbi:MAG: hypothetical protein AMXMBFR64_61800 [Myxococcales bacterium]